MSRPYAEPERRDALVSAAVEIIGERGSLDVTVKDIAKRAGMSSALAFHYFGGKDEIIAETMRHLLRELARDASKRLTNATTPAQRLDAVILASFSPVQFEKNTIAAWLVFYVKAFSSSSTSRLLAIYTSRLASNLHFALRPLVPAPAVEQIAEGLAAMIDGLYIRHALRKSGPDAGEAIELCRQYLDTQIRAATGEGERHER